MKENKYEKMNRMGGNRYMVLRIHWSCAWFADRAKGIVGSVPTARASMVSKDDGADNKEHKGLLIQHSSLNMAAVELKHDEMNHIGGTKAMGTLKEASLTVL